MRAANVIAPFALLAVPLCGFGQSTPYTSVVTDPEVKVRAYFSDQFPVTSTLTRGAVVVVDHEESNGWLAIRPPVGSVSWVPTQFVQRFDPERPLPQNVVVQSEGQVTLAPGQVGVPQPLDNFRKVNVPDGTILVVIGPKVTYQNKTWFPVMPPEGDFRYVPRTAVKPGPAVSETFTVAGASSAKPNAPLELASPALTIPGENVRPAVLPGSVNSWARPGGSSPLWAQAEQAELAGKLDEAERLFFELARKMNEPNGDHDVANQCYTRIHNIREKKRLNQAVSGGGTRVPPPARAEEPRASRTSGTATGADRPSIPPAASDTSRDRERERERDRDRGSDPTGPSRWTGPGFLIRTGYSLDGKTTYALESSPRVVRYYVLEAPGVELKKYLNKRVDLHGVISTRRDVTQPLITVTSVEPAQAND